MSTLLLKDRNFTVRIPPLRLLLVIGVATSLSVGLPFDTTRAEEQKGQKGIYEPVELHKREQHLVETANELEGRFKRRGLRYREPETEQWLSRVASRIYPEPTDSYINYRVFLIRDPSPNAFALADGQIYIHTGMLARLQNESQVAGLMAHEVNHVAGHHHVVAFRSARKKAIASMVLGSVLGGLGGDWGSLIAGIADVGFAMSVLGYSRQLEEEADRRAVGLLRESGYDSAELPKIFDTMNNDPEGESPRIRAKWSTHPLLAERAAYLRGMIRLDPQETFTTPLISQDEYSTLVLAIGLMTVEDYIHVDYPRTALFLAQRLAKQHPKDARVFVALGDAWHALGARSTLTPDQPLTEEEKKQSLRARRKFTRAEREAQRLDSREGRANLKNNMVSAKEAYLDALDIDGAIPEAYRGLGDAYSELFRYKDAARAYLRYLKLAPDAPDRNSVHAQLKTLLAEIKRGTSHAKTQPE
ncbi:MAG: M48 family metalloprotease [Acidiferrobacterales bacterium]